MKKKLKKIPKRFLKTDMESLAERLTRLHDAAPCCIEVGMVEAVYRSVKAMAESRRTWTSMRGIVFTLLGLAENYVNQNFHALAVYTLLLIQTWGRIDEASNLDHYLKRLVHREEQPRASRIPFDELLKAFKAAGDAINKTVVREHTGKGTDAAKDAPKEYEATPSAPPPSPPKAEEREHPRTKAKS